MEAENKKARLKAKLRFTLVFAIALIVTTTGGIVTIVTAQKEYPFLKARRPNMTMCSRNRQNLTSR